MSLPLPYYTGYRYWAAGYCVTRERHTGKWLVTAPDGQIVAGGSDWYRVMLWALDHRPRSTLTTTDAQGETTR